MKHAVEQKVGGRFRSDHALISWLVRHCAWTHTRFHVRTDGKTPYEVLHELSNRGGLACFGETVWARVPGSRLIRGKFEVNWLELVWVGKTDSSDEHLCGDEHGVRKFRAIRRQPESARWRREMCDKLIGDPWEPKPKPKPGAEPPLDLVLSKQSQVEPVLQVGAGVEVPPEVPAPAADHRRWYVTEALVQEHGRTLGCPRCFRCARFTQSHVQRAHRGDHATAKPAQGRQGEEEGLEHGAGGSADSRPEADGPDAAAR